MTDPWLLVAPHRERLVRMARRRTGSLADAEDIASEALLRVATFPTLDPGRVGELLTTVTVRLCVDLARRRAVESSALPRLMPVAADPVDDLLDSAEARFLATVPLTKVERTLLTARLHGLYPSEVAEGLGLSVPAAKSALRRARQKIVAAWHATLGVFGLSRLRRVALAGGVAVTVALAALVINTRPVAPPVPTGAAALETPGRRTLSPASPVESGHGGRVIGLPSPVARRAHPVVAHRTTAPATPVVAVPRVRAPGIRVGGNRVVLDLHEHPVAVVRRCLDRGIDVDPGNASVTCRK